jgi:hypothetical protein
LSKVAPSRSSLLLFGWSPWFLKLSVLFFSFLDFYVFFFFFGLVSLLSCWSLFNFSFLIPPCVTFGLGFGTEILWRVLSVPQTVPFYCTSFFWEMGAES